MFRVPLRSSSMGASALPRPSYDTRRRLVGVMHGSNTWSVNSPARPSGGTAHVPSAPTAPLQAEPAFRAPWGELERQIPYVTITTQPFPLEWWTPPGMRAAAVTRATALPVDLVSRPTPTFQELPEAPNAWLATEPGASPVPTVSKPIAAEPMAAEAKTADPMPAMTDVVATRRPRTAPASREQRQRRGFVTRLAVLAIGLVISLIAVETATRRRG